MSHLLDRMNFLQSKELEQFSNGHGQVTNENRDWEDTYRNRWRHDKVVRSTHGVNCTGSCSWKIYVKSGIVTWETQQTDYPRTRPDLPNHEPRGCARGASYSWYLYSANRVKNPLIRGRLLKVWRKMRENKSPIEAWTARDPERPDPAQRLCRNPRQGRFCPRKLGRGHRNHGRCQRLYRQDLWPRPRLRLLAHPGDVDGVLCRWQPIPQSYGRGLHVLL